MKITIEDNGKTTELTLPYPASDRVVEILRGVIHRLEKTINDCEKCEREGIDYSTRIGQVWKGLEPQRERDKSSLIVAKDLFNVFLR